MCGQCLALEAATANPEKGPHQYTAIGYWNDADEVVIVGITRTAPGSVFGGDDCSEGGPWASASFWAMDDEHAERVADVEARTATRENAGEEDECAHCGGDTTDGYVLCEACRTEVKTGAPMFEVIAEGTITVTDDDEGPTGLVHGPRLGPTI